MAIDPMQPTFREIQPASAIPMSSPGRSDRELQMKEGNPPMEVASAEQEPLTWRKNEDLREKWKKRRLLQDTRHEEELDEPNPTRDESDEDYEGSTVEPEPLQGDEERLEEDEETGSLLDGLL